MIAGAERGLLPVDVPCLITGAATLAALDRAVAGKKNRQSAFPYFQERIPATPFDQSRCR
jgi:hypothetical protein